MVGKYLLELCSPTLSGLKTGSMFNYTFEDMNELLNELDYWNRELNHQDIFITILKINRDRALIYVYKKEKLQSLLSDSEIFVFLKKEGYCGVDCGSMIECLKKRVQNKDHFPHEIGIFLGYPIADVKGFIDNSGKNCKMCGYWKVYKNVTEAKKIFERYNKCKEIYLELYNKGKSFFS